MITKKFTLELDQRQYGDLEELVSRFKKSKVFGPRVGKATFIRASILVLIDLKKRGYFDDCFSKINSEGALASYIISSLSGEGVNLDEPSTTPDLVRREFRRNYNYILSQMIHFKKELSCSKCFSPEDISIDHIFPISMGGTNDLDNLQFMCKRCNSKKSNKINF